MTYVWGLSITYKVESHSYIAQGRAEMHTLTHTSQAYVLSIQTYPLWCDSLESLEYLFWVALLCMLRRFEVENSTIASWDPLYAGSIACITCLHKPSWLKLKTHTRGCLRNSS